MMFRLFITLFFGSIFRFYGQELTKELELRLNKIDSYVKSIRISNKFSESRSEGSIIDENNPDRNEGFSYYEYFLPDKKELFRVECFSSTNINLTENYFYKKNKLLYAESQIEYLNGEKKFTKIYLENGKLIYGQKSEFENSKNLMEKGNNYLNEFMKE